MTNNGYGSPGSSPTTAETAKVPNKADKPSYLERVRLHPLNSGVSQSAQKRKEEVAKAKKKSRKIELRLIGQVLVEEVRNNCYSTVKTQPRPASQYTFMDRIPRLTLRKQPAKSKPQPVSCENEKPVIIDQPPLTASKASVTQRPKLVNPLTPAMVTVDRPKLVALKKAPKSLEQVAPGTATSKPKLASLATVKIERPTSAVSKSLVMAANSADPVVPMTVPHGSQPVAPEATANSPNTHVPVTASSIPVQVAPATSDCPHLVTTLKRTGDKNQWFIVNRGNEGPPSATPRTKRPLSPAAVAVVKRPRC